MSWGILLMWPMRAAVVAAGWSALLLVCPFSRAAILYDGSLGTLPSSQGWLYGSQPLFGSLATQQVTMNSALLDTTAQRTDRAGYFSVEPFFQSIRHPAVLPFDRQHGFSLQFDLQVLSENHDPRDDNADGRIDRAGFAVVAISQDLWGLELAIFADRVSVYEDNRLGAQHAFTQAEFALWDTTAALTDYRLDVIADRYTLHADSQPILQGDLRDYRFAQATPDVYEIPSFLFFGDDTTSADSRVRIGGIQMETPLLQPCDLNQDLSIDAADAGLLFAVWGQSAGADLNQDAIVDAADAGICFSNWTGDLPAGRTILLPEPMAYLGWALPILALRRRTARLES